MVDSPHISPAIAALAKKQFRRLFQDIKLLGHTENLVFYYDENMDGQSASEGPYEVLILLARREASTRHQDGMDITEVDGEFQKELPFDVQPEMRFTLASGDHGQIVVVFPVENNVRRATFRLEQ